MHNEITKEQRAVIFNRLLEQAGVPSWGRGTRLSEACSVSPATAAGWLAGSLPRDSIALLLCADKFNFDVYMWVSGVSRGKGINTPKLTSAIARLRQHELDNEQTLDPEAFSTVCVMLYEDEEKAEFLLQNMNLLQKK
tara:strand:- start:49 stop:462 length:414 start_codon:yes stop_codon:yes gene_type:complete